MKITNILSTPIFISKYIEKGKLEIEYSLFNFCKFILNRDPDNTNISDSKISMSYDVPQNEYDVRYFINTYKDLSNLSNKLECRYEEELDIPKTVSNESFKVEISGGDSEPMEFIIDKLEDNKLTISYI